MTESGCAGSASAIRKEETTMAIVYILVGNFCTLIPQIASSYTDSGGVDRGLVVYKYGNPFAVIYMTRGHLPSKTPIKSTKSSVSNFSLEMLRFILPDEFR